MSERDTDMCCCGHVRDEHEVTTMQPCTVCDCVAFDQEPDDEDGPLDLEDQLDQALDRAFPPRGAKR